MKLEWLDQTRPYATDFDDIYYAEEDGLAESRYVFIQQNNLSERIEKGSEFISVCEIGFGTGLNFIATWDEWIRHSKPSTQWLHYFSCEKFPLSPQQIDRALSRWPELRNIREEFLKYYIELPKGFYRLRFSDVQITLTLLIGDAKESLSEMSGPIDAWYLDGFAPRKNPELWSKELFAEVGRLSHPETTFATYTVAGFVRQNLIDSGFEIEKFQGFGRKRQMLKGRFVRQSPAYVPRTRAASGQKVAVVGGGIAGSSAAYALASRGFEVSLFETHSALAQEASGNPVGITLPSLPSETSALSQLGLSGLVYLRSLKKIWADSGQTGLLQFWNTEKEYEKIQRSLSRHEVPESFARWVSQDEASQISGLKIQRKGLFLSRAGFLDLRNACSQLTENIRLHLSSPVLKLERQSNHWKLTTPFDVQEFDQVLVCGAHASLKLDPLSHLPLRRVRGQIAMIRSKALQSLQLPLCFEKYICPNPTEDNFLLGASYDRENLSSDLRPEDNIVMVRDLKALLGDEIDIEIESCRVNFRTSSPGQVPFVGEAFDSNGNQMEGLFVMAAFASRGSVYCGISGELVASKLNGEPLPLKSSLVRQISPRRLVYV